jgi:hypothetical protein
VSATAVLFSINYQANVRFWPKADMRAGALHMSAFGGKADMTFAAHMCAFDPKRTSGTLVIEAKFTRFQLQG